METRKKIVYLLQINYMEMALPNRHYFGVDLSKFPVGVTSNDAVFLPVDKPSGNIRAALTRNVTAKI